MIGGREKWREGNLIADLEKHLSLDPETEQKNTSVDCGIVDCFTISSVYCWHWALHGEGDLFSRLSSLSSQG